MKTKKELNEIKEEYQALAKKLSELSDSELNEVVGGFADSNFPSPVIPESFNSEWQTHNGIDIDGVATPKHKHGISLKLEDN